MSEKNLAELIQEFQEENCGYTNNVSNLEEIIVGLNDEYGDQSFGYDRIIKRFLEDNPGCVEAIIDWIGEQNLPEWRENIEGVLEEDEEDC